MKKLIALLMVSCMALTFAACGGNTGTTAPTTTEGTTAPGQTTTEAPTTQAGEKVSSKDTITLGADREPATLSPGGVTVTIAESIMANVLDTLLKYDENVIPQPCLATSWKQLDDLTWEFKLREGVKFTNGEPFTSKDVLYSFNRLPGTNNGATEMTYIDLAGCSAPDDFTFILKTKSVYAFTEAMLCQPVFSIVNEKAINDVGEDAHGRAPVGTGAFIVTDWKAGDTITLTRNDNYWGEKALLKTVYVKILTEGTARTMNLETGDIDVAMMMQVSDIERIESADETYVMSGPQNSIRYIGINTSKPIMDNQKVRQALFMATDTETIRKVIYGENSSAPAVSPVPPGFAGRNEELTQYKFDPDAAKALLSEAGFADGFKTSYTYLSNSTNNMCAEMIQQMWAAVGIELELKPMESGALSTALNSGDFEIGNFGSNLKLCDAGEGMYAFFHSSSRGSTSNRTWLNDGELDRQLDQIMQTTDAEARNKLVFDAQIRVQELVPMIYICHAYQVYGLRSDVRGWDVVLYTRNDFSKLYFAEQ